MRKFNGGRPYHGSSSVAGGQLLGATGETDYFYFFCPNCPGDEVNGGAKMAVGRPLVA